MANLKAGTSIGGYLALHTDNTKSVALNGPLTITGDRDGDGGWAEGIHIKNTGVSGEAALSFNNSFTNTNYWITGMNQSDILRWDYGPTFEGTSAMSLTTGGNLDITGTMTIASHIYQGTGDHHYFGTTAGDIYHDGTNFYVTSNIHGGQIFFQGEDTAGTNRAMIYCDPDGATTLYWGPNGAKLATNSGGVTITGTATATTFSGALSGNATTATWADTVDVNSSSSSSFYNIIWHSSDTLYGSTSSKLTTQPSTGYIKCGGLTPLTDNTGVVGTGVLTWSNGQFTNLTIDSTLTVRGAIDLADSDILRFGSSDDVEHFFNGTYYYTDINTGTYWYVRQSTTTRFRFTMTTGQFDADADIIGYSTSVSDGRLKENIKELETPLEKVLKLRGVNFEWKDKHKDGTHIGYIAQEIEEIIPEAVVERNLMKYDDGLFKVVRYEELIPYLSEAIKEQQKEIEFLKEEIKKLK